MHTMTRRPALRRFVLRGATVAAGALAAATWTLAIPQSADAAVTRLGATPDLSFGVGTNYGTGCNYTLHAFVNDPAAPVTFYDNGAAVGRIRPAGAYALAPWVPATTGPHMLTAVQDGQPADLPAASLELSVGSGMPIGNGCGVFGG